MLGKLHLIIYEQAPIENVYNIYVYKLSENDFQYQAEPNNIIIKYQETIFSWKIISEILTHSRFPRMESSGSPLNHLTPKSDEEKVRRGWKVLREQPDSLNPRTRCHRWLQPAANLSRTERTKLNLIDILFKIICGVTRHSF